MSLETLQILDYLFIFAHLVIVAFNLFGWIWERALRLHLVVILITAFSWVALGYFYGWGYCFLTDWHWQIKYQLGESPPPSFVKWAVDALFGVQSDPFTIDLLVITCFLGALIASVHLNFRKKR